MRPLAEVHIFIVEEEAFVQQTNLVEHAPPDQQARSGQPLNVMWILVASTLVIPVCLPYAQAANDPQHGWEGAVRQLEATIRVSQLRPYNPDPVILLHDRHEGADRARVGHC